LIDLELNYHIKQEEQKEEEEERSRHPSIIPSIIYHIHLLI